MNYVHINGNIHIITEHKTLTNYRALTADAGSTALPQNQNLHVYGDQKLPLPRGYWRAARVIKTNKILGMSQCWYIFVRS